MLSRSDSSRVRFNIAPLMRIKDRGYPAEKVHRSSRKFMKCDEKMIFFHSVIRWVHVQKNYKNLPSSVLLGINGLRGLESHPTTSDYLLFNSSYSAIKLQFTCKNVE